MVSNEISPVKNYEIIKYRGDDCFPESSMNLNTILLMENRIYYISVALLYGVSEPLLVRTRNYNFLKKMVSLGVRINSAINFTDDLYIKGYMLKGKERNYYHPMIVLLMSEDVKFDEFFLWDFVKDALSPEVPPEYLYYYLNTNTKYNEPSKYGSKSAMLADLMKTKPENYLVKAKMLIRYGADKTFCDEDGKCFNDYVTNEELEKLILLFIINFL